MQSTKKELEEENNLPLFCGKMYPESSTQRTTHSAVFLQGLRGKMSLLSQQGESGRTQVGLLVPKEQSLGGCLMPNISEWPNAAAVCLLSQVLEKTTHEKYYLSSRACEGILRRAEKRGKTLPPLLQQALEVTATMSEQQENLAVI